MFAFPFFVENSWILIWVILVTEASLIAGNDYGLKYELNWFIKQTKIFLKLWSLELPGKEIKQLHVAVCISTTCVDVFYDI